MLQNIRCSRKMEYYSAAKRHKILLYCTTWMNPENIMLSERNQLQKTQMLYDFIYMECPEQANPQSKSGCQCWREGEWGITANEYGGSFWGDENVLKLDSSDGCTICEYTKSH